MIQIEFFIVWHSSKQKAQIPRYCQTFNAALHEVKEKYNQSHNSKKIFDLILAEKYQKISFIVIMHIFSKSIIKTYSFEYHPAKFKFEINEVIHKIILVFLKE